MKKKCEKNYKDVKYIFATKHRVYIILLLGSFMTLPACWLIRIESLV